ncbi:MAG: glycosyltransferase family 4 protein [Opitutae bacterium]
MPTQTPIKLLTMEYPPTRGGAGVYCEELAHASNELGMDIEVLAPLGSHSGSSVKVIQLPFRGSQGWICSLKIIKFLKTQSLEKIALHIADPGAQRAMVRFGWLLPKPAKFILTIHGSEIPKFSRNPIERLFFRNLLARADKIHVLSKYNEAKLVQYYPEIRGRTFLVPGAPARETLPKSNPLESKDYAKRKLVLLCVGRIHPRKGQLQLLQAIEQLPRHLKERLICQFVGPNTKPAYVNQILTMSKAVGCEIQFLGNLENSDLKKAYQLADIFALTSIRQHNSVEGFGFVYLEASSHGLPILAHRVGGVEDAVIDGKTGLLCEPNKQNELLLNLRQLIEQSEKRKELGNAGIKWAAKHSWENIAQKLYKSD